MGSTEEMHVDRQGDGRVGKQKPTDRIPPRDLYEENLVIVDNFSFYSSKFGYTSYLLFQKCVSMHLVRPNSFAPRFL